MPVWLQALLVATVQSLLVKLATWMVAHSIWTPAQSEVFASSAVATAIVLWAWNWVQEHRKRQQVNTALALPPGSTRDDVKAEIEKGNAPPASVPADRAPYLKGGDKTGRYTPEDPPKDPPTP